MSEKDRTRNFCIIAHIDHGKSTLADRILEQTGVFERREMVDQILDSMELERERGITIKSKAVHMIYRASDGLDYTLNLIDTPGHVDFTYEVSRALAACEGALRVVDATQGIEAQTLANVYLALEHDLEIIPVINKIDLPSARPEEVRSEIEDVIGLDASYAPCISAKTGLNVEQVLESIVEHIPAPEGDPEKPLQALIFDAFYDNYRGAICFVRIKEGTIRPGMRMRLMATGGEFDVVEVGIFSPGYERFSPTYIRISPLSICVRLPASSAAPLSVPSMAKTFLFLAASMARAQGLPCALTSLASSQDCPILAIK